MNGEVLKAIGRPEVATRLSLARIALAVVPFYLAARTSIYHLAAAEAALAWVTALAFTPVLTRILAIPWRRPLAACGPGIRTALPAIVVGAAWQAAPAALQPSIWSFVLLSAVAGSACLAVLVVYERELTARAIETARVALARVHRQRAGGGQRPDWHKRRRQILNGGSFGSRSHATAASTASSMLTFVGDILIPPEFRSTLVIAEPWVGNLEGPITTGGRPVAGKITLRSEPVQLLESLGSLPIAVGLANNHILDFGLVGYHDTVEGTVVGWASERSARDAATRKPREIRSYSTVAAERIALLGYAAEETHPITIDGVGPAMLSLLPRVARDIVNRSQRGSNKGRCLRALGSRGVRAASPGGPYACSDDGRSRR